jgi:hypothetical protein
MNKVNGVISTNPVTPVSSSLLSSYSHPWIEFQFRLFWCSSSHEHRGIHNGHAQSNRWEILRLLP